MWPLKDKTFTFISNAAKHGLPKTEKLLIVYPLQESLNRP